MTRRGRTGSTGDGAIPSQMQLVLPLIGLLADSDRPVAPKRAAADLADLFGLSHEQRSRVSVDRNGDRSDVWRRHVRFARLKAAAMGFVVGEGAGWRATDEARAALDHRREAIHIAAGPADGEAGRPFAFTITLDTVLPTVHTLVNGDSRHLSWIDSESVALSISSIPYFDLKDYGDDDGQLATARDYATFLDELDKVIREVGRVLMPGGRFACNVGDVLRGRRRHGSHHVLPLHADLLVRGRAAGLDVVNGIIWAKPGNRTSEAGGPGFLGKPGQPNGIISSEVENIVMLRKPGGYRHPTPEQRRLSAIAPDEYQRLFQPIWTGIPGARATARHPAPYPVEIPRRLTKMFSFAGDLVLDPFAGDNTSAVAAALEGRDSVSVEINPRYFCNGAERIARMARELAA